MPTGNLGRRKSASGDRKQQSIESFAWRWARESLRGTAFPRRQVVPVQLDFAMENNLVEYRGLPHKLFGDEPILYSLLGNSGGFGIDLLPLASGRQKPAPARRSDRATEIWSEFRPNDRSANQDR